MATVDSGQTAAQQKLAAAFAHNAAVLDQTLWKWIPFGTTAGTSQPAFALNQSYSFGLSKTSTYLDKIRIFLANVPITVTEGTGTSPAALLTSGGLWSVLGTLHVALGRDVYRVRAGLLPLLLSTFQKFGRTYHYPGMFSYPYSSLLYGSTNGSTTSTDILTGAGTNVVSGYLDVPMTLLEAVKDPDGIMPTLSEAGVSVTFTTQPTLTPPTGAVADALSYPFVTTGGTTVALGTNASGNTGSIFVMAHAALFKTVTSTAALPPFEAGVGFQVLEQTQTPDTPTNFFATFQGQSSNVKLVKSVLVLNNPGEVTAAFGDPTQITTLDLMYDASEEAVPDSSTNNPPDSFVMNRLIDQRARYGDLPANVFVFDFASGTDAEYPNDYNFLDLSLFKNAGVRINRKNAWQAGAQAVFCNMYLNPTLYNAAL